MLSLQKLLSAIKANLDFDGFVFIFWLDGGGGNEY